jgi:rhodanese-related sulfurtransferase
MTTPKSLIQMMGCASKGKNPLESLPIIPILDQHEIQLRGLRSGEEFENAHIHDLKHVEAEVHEHVTLSWEP